MDDSGSELAKQVAALAESLRSVEARVAALEEAAAPKGPRPVPVPPAEPVPATSAAPESPLPSYAALAGKCLFVLAGAFLVRALTDSGTLPRGAGVALGLAYAMTWLVVADRTGRAGSAAAATAWGVTALVIACPLVWEASTRFNVLPPAGAAGVLFAVAVAALAASSRRNLYALAWASVISALVTAIVLIVATHAIVPLAAFLVFFTAASWAASVRRGWPGLPWAPAAAADLVVLEIVWIASRPEGLPEAYLGLSPGAVLALALALFAAPLAGTVRRAFSRAGTPGAFEAVQLGAALFLIVFAVSRLTPLAGLPPSLVWGLAGFVAAVAPARTVGSMAPAYGAVLLLAAAVVSGLAGFARHAFLGSPVTGMPAPDSLVVLALSAAAAALLAARVRAGAVGPAARGAMFALACVSIVGAGALAVLGLALVVAPDGEPGRTAAARGAVLAAASVLLASLRRLLTLAPLARLTYPVLAIAGLKLLIDDLPHGRPSTLVATFVLYGAALIVVPRILRSARAKHPPGSAVGG
jgi:hypothetical protein